MLLELGLPSFDTLIFNSRASLSQGTQNGFIVHICRLYSVQFFVLFIVCDICVSVRMCLFVLFLCFYGLMPERNAFIHSLITKLVIHIGLVSLWWLHATSTTWTACHFLPAMAAQMS